MSNCVKLQVIHEVLRLGNVAPGLLRRATKDIQFNGTTIEMSSISFVVANLIFALKLFKLFYRIYRSRRLGHCSCEFCSSVKPRHLQGSCHFQSVAMEGALNFIKMFDEGGIGDAFTNVWYLQNPGKLNSSHLSLNVGS